MKAIAICGSPRVNGNTELLLSRFLDRLSENNIDTELIKLAGKKLATCQACGMCYKNKDKKCVISNDDFQPIFDKMLEADIIILGSPVYFSSATAEITALMDRAGYVARSNSNLLSRKIGAPVVVARRAGQNFTYAQMLLWYTISDMIVPGGTYWNIAFGRKIGDVSEDKEGLQTIDQCAKNTAWLAQKLYGSEA